MALIFVVVVGAGLVWLVMVGVRKALGRESVLGTLFLGTVVTAFIVGPAIGVAATTSTQILVGLLAVYAIVAVETMRLAIRRARSAAR